MTIDITKILGDEIRDLNKMLEDYTEIIGELEERLKYLEDNTVKYNDEIIFSRPIEPELEEGFKLAQEIAGQIERNK